MTIKYVAPAVIHRDNLPYCPDTNCMKEIRDNQQSQHAHWGKSYLHLRKQYIVFPRAQHTTIQVTAAVVSPSNLENCSIHSEGVSRGASLKYSFVINLLLLFKNRSICESRHCYNSQRILGNKCI